MIADTLSRRVLVLGARGFLGEHIVLQLAETDCDVVAAVRPGSQHAYASPRIRVIEGDLLDASFVRRVLDQADAVIFAAGRTWQPDLALADYQRENVGITARFFEALGHRPRMRVVFTSSLATLTGSRTPHVFAEEADRSQVCEDWLTPYARAKILCERLALNAAERGNQVVVLNPGQLMGPGVHAGSNLGSAFVLLWFCQGKAPFYIHGGTTYSDVRDVARAHVAALSRGRSGQRYVLGGHCLERSDFYARVVRLTGVRRPWGLPVGFVYLVMALTDALAFLSAGCFRSPVHRSFARGEGLYYFGDSQEAVQELGYRIRPIDVTILDTLRDYHARGLLPPDLDFVKDLTVEDAPALVLLRRIARKSAYWRFLLPRAGRVYEICCSNDELRAALTRLLEASQADMQSTKVPGSRAHQARDRRLLDHFFEYLYFASDEFMRQVE
jgi:dihydroflavonol-4-reductase